MSNDVNDDMNNDMNKQFAQHARETLHQSERELDSETRAKLSRTRRAALKQGEQPYNNWLLGRAAPAWGALAAAALIAVVVLRTNTPLPGQPSVTVAKANPETETVSIEEELELYENLELLEFYENLEFYEWLADEAPEEVAS